MPQRYKQNSSYSITPQTFKYLDLYEPSLTVDNLDLDTFELTVENRYDRRPDLLAYDLFKDSRLWWVFVHYNRDLLKDPINDFRSGITIDVPKNYSR